MVTPRINCRDGADAHGWGLICDDDHMFMPTGGGWQHCVRDGYADGG